MMDVIIFGGGKFAGNIVDEFSTQINPIGYIDNINNTYLYDEYKVKFLGKDLHQLMGKKNKCNNIILCVGSEGSVEPRTACYLKIKEAGFCLPSLIHESAIVSKKAIIGKGSIIQSRCIIQPNVRIGANNIISVNSYIGHDSKLADHVFVAPGVNIGGSVEIEKNTHIGIGACVIQKVHIGKKCLIGASACVICNIPDNSKVVGVPGKITPNQ